MLTRLTAILYVATAVGSAQQAKHWELPNFSDRLDVAAENPSDREIDGVVTLDAAEVRKMAPGFPGTLAIATEENEPTTFLESQPEDLNANRGSAAFTIAVKLAAHEKKILSIYYSSTLHDEFPAVKRVHASHNYGSNHATAAIESELIGYRTYGGFFFDVQAHAKGNVGLLNSVLGYSSISYPPNEGEDVIHLGDTLGLGGLFLREGEGVYRPPLNTPGYTHRAPKPEEPVYRIVSTGPLRAIVEAALPDWTVGNDHVSLRALYEMEAGSEVIHCHWWITPIEVSRSYEVGVGIRNLPDARVLKAPGVVVTSGIQQVKIGRVALGLTVANGESHRAGVLQTPDGENQILMFKEVLRSGHAVSGEYLFAAAWSGSGWANPAKHVRDVLQNEAAKPHARVVAHRSNPNPGGLEGEPK